MVGLWPVVQHWITYRSRPREICRAICKGIYRIMPPKTNKGTYGIMPKVLSKRIYKVI